jgi:MFS family permease
VLFYSAVFPFTYFSTDFFVAKFGFSLAAAGRTTGILVVAAMIFTPLFGWFIDRWGRRASLMVFGSLLFAPTYFVLGATVIPPWLPMAVMGIAFSLVPAALWAAVPQIVEQRRLGTAYGLMTMIQNIGMTVAPVAAGALTDRTGGYEAAMVFFGLLGSLGLVFALLLLRRERGPGCHGLEVPSAELG